MLRTVGAELLDELPAADPRAIRSRRDLQRINIVMGHARVIAAVLGDLFPQSTHQLPLAPRTLVELGAGDGTLLLRVARRLGPRPPPMRAMLVDRQPQLSAQTRAEFAALGWHVESIQADVFDWLGRREAETADVTVANLFLHHFTGASLPALLDAAERQTRAFVACEPLRSPTALAGAALLRLLGCSDVTLHDAKVSVRAGFRDNELSALWPGRQGWRLAEWRPGPFTHAFHAAQVPEPTLD